MLDAPRPAGDDDFYPYYSEDPVTESDWHRIAIGYIENSLQAHFDERPDAYVASNLFVYYQEGDREKCVSPDVFVCFGSDKKLRKVHKNWLNGVPAAVFEVTSESSRVSDQGEKRAKYAIMGIQEYYLFDPLGEYLAGKLRAYRREGDELIPVVCPPRFESPLLGVGMQVEENLLRLFDLRSGRPYPTMAEAYLQAEEERARAEEERARAEEERARRQAAESRLEVLEQELRRHKDS